MSKNFGSLSAARSKQRGVVLIVALVLLMILTVLGISGMTTATLELTMAGNAQFYQQAFQAAETGLAIAIARRDFDAAIGGAAIVLPPTTLGDGSSSVQAVTTFQLATPIPDRAFSLGLGADGTVQAYHFDVVAEGTGPRNAKSTHTQSFYIVGPGGL
jgi:type II secretory pathway pseudopilin PulG